jgi:predicted kinase
MKKVIISIGIPGAGKTTVIKEFAKQYGYGYISPDDIRIEMLGNIADQSKNKEVAEEVRKRTKGFLDIGESVVVDTVFGNSMGRKDFLDFAKASGAEKVQGVFFDVPVEVAKERNINREDHQVPEPIIEKIAKDFEESKPAIEEGFDGIFTVDEYQHLVEAEIKRGETSIRKSFR